MALAITSLAVAAVATVLMSSLVSTDNAVDRTIADGIAQQMLEEVMTKRYAATTANAYDTPLLLGPSLVEMLGPGRSAFNDTDDFVGFSKSPPQGIYGETLGRGNDAGGNRDPAFGIGTTYFSDWRQRFRVYYVSASDLTTESSTATSYRCCEAIVEMKRSDGSWVSLSTRRRVYSYVPPNL